MLGSHGELHGTKTTNALYHLPAPIHAVLKLPMLQPAAPRCHNAYGERGSKRTHRIGEGGRPDACACGDMRAQKRCKKGADMYAASLRQDRPSEQVAIKAAYQCHSHGEARSFHSQRQAGSLAGGGQVAPLAASGSRVHSSRIGSTRRALGSRSRLINHT